MQYNRRVKNKATQQQETREINVDSALKIRDALRDIMILMAHDMGISNTKIAEIHGLNKSTVGRIIKNNKELLSVMRKR